MSPFWVPVRDINKQSNKQKNIHRQSPTCLSITKNIILVNSMQIWTLLSSLEKYPAHLSVTVIWSLKQTNFNSCSIVQNFLWEQAWLGINLMHSKTYLKSETLSVVTRISSAAHCKILSQTAVAKTLYTNVGKSNQGLSGNRKGAVQRREKWSRRERQDVQTVYLFI